MNPISQYLVNEILKDNTTLIYGGGFKFPTRGHLEVVKQSLEQHPQFNKYIIFVGSGERDGITQQQSIDIWNIYKKYFPFNIEIIPVPSPVKAVFEYSKENPQENVIWVIGGRQDNEDDMKDFINRTKTIKKYPNITASQVITPLSNISGTKARQVLKTGDKSEVISYLPSNISDEDIEQIIDILMPPKQLNEIEEFDRIEYYTSFVSNVVPSDFNVFRDGDKIIVDNITNLPLFSIPESMSDPKKGTGKKPKGSGRRLYTDEDPSDTVSIKFSSKQDIIDTLSKSSFKSKSHKRQSQIINVIHQRVRAAYQRAKDPKVKARLKTALDYAEQRKEASKEKTQRLKKENVAPNHTGKSAPYGSGYKELNENASYSKDIDYKSYIKELTNYMIEDGWNILPLPKIIFRHGNKENAKNLLGKTAYYDPNTQTIVLYTEGRHPKDILRSFSHEMVHHMQNIEDRLGNITTTNTQEDDHLNDIEAEANLKGTMTFRNWTDSLNEKKNKDPFGINQYARELAQGLEEQSQNYIIYCDMDGVIADFDKRFTDLSGMSPNQYEEKYGIEQFWNFIDNEIGVRFWVGIPWMQDGKQLWEYIKKYKPTLLSAPSRNNESRLGKRLWVKKHIPGVKLVLASRANKQDYAKPNAILIDDRPDTIIEWENKGGIGILHKSAEETIQKLKSLDL